ncbi:MAG: hypothetical protein Q9220_003570 [cf. Caloplaca sp. 1 TL-2023]
MDLGLSHVQHPTLGSLPGVSGHQFRGMSTAVGHHGNPQGLPKLDTHHFNIDVAASMRTAPPYAGFNGGTEVENLWYGHGSTINPAQLHFSHSPHSLSMDPMGSPTFQFMPQYHTGPEEESTLSWMSGFDNQMSFSNANEQAIDGSSPSAMSTGSQDGLGELVLDGGHSTLQTSSVWQPPMMAQIPVGPGYPMDYHNPSLGDFYQTGQLSPKSLQAQMGDIDHFFSSPPPIHPQTSTPFLHGLNIQLPNSSMAQVETPSNSAASVSSSSNRHSSVTSMSTDSITDATRQAILASLAQPSAFNYSHVKTSHPAVSSPLSPALATRQSSGNNIPLPSTYDLQRYIAAYVKFFHPHLPFLHVPSLSFDAPEFGEGVRSSSGLAGFNQLNVAGGAGSLILSMAAIGAFYEYDKATSKDLFELAKRMIHIYLEERRQAAKSATVNGSTMSFESSAQPTPLWLVQAMLLNVIYGHNCGDKTAAGIATTHCASLISLARAAGLTGPLSDSAMQYVPMQRPDFSVTDDIQMDGEGLGSDQWSHQQRYLPNDIYADWQRWKTAEERKRTLYTVFILSSLLVSAYNHAPALVNSEVHLDLPCDEELWAAETAEAWLALKNSDAAGQTTVSFATALSSLLTASHRHPYRQCYQLDQPFGSSQQLKDLPACDLRPSTFGCLILINALHNYIWETRQRHAGRPWTTHETEAMHAHIEPALRAWQAAWANNPHHSPERPNPFGAGSLSADCIPLLDLAYVRLFVNLGRSKEAFFQRDWEGMASELAFGHEFVQHADSSPDASKRNSTANELQSSLGQQTFDTQKSEIKLECTDTNDNLLHTLDPSLTQSSSKRERHLRKAAFFAANSLAMSDKLGVTFAELTSRELPIQSALCAFDCAQVVAEWCAAVQQRVGQYVGMLGRDDIDFTQIPAIMLLNEEDCKLFGKIHDIIRSAEIKMADSSSMSATQALQTTSNLPSLVAYDYGSKVLLITAHMLERAAVWPITQEMAQSLQTQAVHMNERARNSLGEARA